MTKKRSLPHLLGRNVLKRLAEGPIIYSQERPKVQAAIDEMVKCTLVAVKNDTVCIAAYGVEL